MDLSVMDSSSDSGDFQMRTLQDQREEDAEAECVASFSGFEPQPNNEDSDDDEIEEVVDVDKEEEDNPPSEDGSNLNSTTPKPLVAVQYILKAIKKNDLAAVEDHVRNGKFIPGNALYWAIKCQNIDIVRLLLDLPEVDKDFNNYQHEGDTPLHTAIKKNCNDDIIKLLLDKGCDVNARNYFGKTPLHYAVMFSSHFAILQLSERGVDDIDSKDSDQNTPLFLAVKNGDLEAVCMLLCFGADVNEDCSDDLTPFKYAIKERNSLITDAMFDYCDNFPAVNKSEETMLYLAFRARSCVIQAKVKYGADEPDSNPYGRALLSYALAFGDAKLFKRMWHRLDFEDLSPTALVLLVMECRYSLSDWVECVYEIFTNDSITSLIMRISTTNSMFFQFLFRDFYKRHVPKDDRIGIIMCFLSYGAEICMNDVDLICELYGFGEEFELLVNYATFKRDDMYVGKFTYSLAKYALGQDFKHPEYYIRFIFGSLAEGIHPAISFYGHCSNEDAVKWLGYFIISDATKQSIISVSSPDLCEAILEKLKVVPEIPSLLQLARDEVRKDLKKKCWGKSPSYYYKYIKDLKLPRRLENVLLFKEPVYL